MSEKLETLFSSAARVDILCLFLLNPDRQFYQREIERETGQPIRAVQREVKRMAEIDLVSSSKEGNRLFYSLNPGFPLLAELTALFRKDAGVEMMDQAAVVGRTFPPEPSTIRQPFVWMETLPVRPLPGALRKRQVEGEWDRAY
jgi:hypothetical protein